MAAFHFYPILLFNIKIIIFFFLLYRPSTLPESSTYRFENIEILFPSEGPAEGKKNKPPDGKYKPSAGVMHKIPDTFFFFFSLNKTFLLEGGKSEERSYITQITYNNIVICMNGSLFYFFLFLV